MPGKIVLKVSSSNSRTAFSNVCFKKRGCRVAQKRSNEKCNYVALVIKAI